MKKLLFAMVAALAISANAATWTKMGGMQVVDQAGLTECVMKLGEITGNQMLGAMLAAQITELPGSDFFGAMRQGGSIYLPFYMDADKLAKTDDVDDLSDAVQFAVIYPMALPKEEFLKLHPEAVETNGLLRVNGNIFTSKDEWDDDEVAYVVLSEDGKWAAASDQMEQAVAAAGDFPIAARAMAGDLVRFEILPRGFAELRKVLEEVEDEDVKKYFGSFDSCRVALRISDAGIDLYGTIRTVEGSFLSKAGEVVLPEDPFAFDDGTAVAAVAHSFLDESGTAKSVDKILDILKENGFDCKRFVSCSEADGVCRISADLKGAIKYYSIPSNQVDEVDFDAAFEKIGELEWGGLKTATKPSYISVGATGQKPKFTVSQRFAAVLPEVKGKPIFFAGTYSISALVQTVVEAVMSAVDEETRAEAAPIVALLPKECAGGIAGAEWRDGGEYNIMWRLSSDELRNIVTGVSSAMMFAMMNESSSGGDEDDCSADDDDEEDVSEDDED